MTNLILTDVDDVLLDWRKSMLGHLMRYTDFHVRDLPDVFRDASILIHDEDVLRHGYPEAALTSNFNKSPHFSAMHAHLDAAAVVPELARRGFRFIAISAAGEGQRITEQRKRNLDAIFGPVFEDVILVPLHGDKREALSRFAPAIWVEDNWTNASHGADAGHKSFLMVDRREPPKRDTRVQHVTSWAEIAARLGETIQTSACRSAA